LLLSLLPHETTGLAQQAEPPPSAVEACLQQAHELLSQNKFAEVADNYLCASREVLKQPDGEHKAKEYLANYHLYRAWGLYSGGKLSGMFGRANLEEAIQRAVQARELWAQADNRMGERVAEGWHLYLVGVKYG